MTSYVQGKLRYQKPVLIEFGTLREMTLATSTPQGNCDNPGQGGPPCNNKTT